MYVEIISCVLVNSEFSSLCFFFSISQRVIVLNDVILRASTNIESTFFTLNDHLEFFYFPFILEPSLFAFIIMTVIQIQLFFCILQSL